MEERVRHVSTLYADNAYMDTVRNGRVVRRIAIITATRTK